MLAYENHCWVNFGCHIKAHPEEVWKVIIQPEFTQQYMYNCQLHSNWEIGSEAIWKEPMEDGSFVDRVNATVLKYKPPHLVSFCVYHKQPDHQFASTKLIFQIKPVDSGSELTIAQGDFSELINGGQLYKECEKGWRFVLPKLIETCKHNLLEH